MVNLTSIYFDETVFTVSPVAEVRIVTSNRNFVEIWEDSVMPPIDPYRIYVKDTDVQAKVKNTTEDKNAEITLIVSRIGVGENTIYTLDLQNNQGNNLPNTHVEISLTEIQSVEASIREKTHKNKDEHYTTITNKIVDFYQEKMKEFLEAPKDFFLRFETLLTTADSKNYIKHTRGADVEVHKKAHPSLRH